MSKSIFVMNTPKCCGECPMSGTDVCRKWNMKDLGVFPKDCPLKEVPQKLAEERQLERIDDRGNIEAYGKMIDRYAVGYNACINEILKERDGNE